MKKLGNLLKIVAILTICLYAIISVCNQQKLLNTYSSNVKELNAQIALATEYQEQLNELKENVNSKEYIEQIAREKLDMYKSNERVYINNE